MKNIVTTFTHFCICICFCACSTLVTVDDHPVPPTETTCSPVSGIMACYSFSEGGKDNSGNNYTAKIVGATSTSDRFGKANSAYSFTRGNYIELPANTFKTDEFTYAAWVKPDHIPQQGEVFMILNSGSGQGDHAMVLAKTNVTGWGMWSYLNNQGYSEYTYSGSLPTDVTQWYHLVASRSNDLLRVYLNGSLVTSQKMSAKAFYGDNIRTLIGMRFDGTASFTGSIDEVKLYNRALNDQEAKQIYDMK